MCRGVFPWLLPVCIHPLIWYGFFSPLAHPHTASRDQQGPPHPVPPQLSVCSLGSRGETTIPTDACSFILVKRRQKMLGLGAPGASGPCLGHDLLS